MGAPGPQNHNIDFVNELGANVKLDYHEQNIRYPEQ